MPPVSKGYKSQYQRRDEEPDEKAPTRPAPIVPKRVLRKICDSRLKVEPSLPRAPLSELWSRFQE